MIGVNPAPFTPKSLHTVGSRQVGAVEQLLAEDLIDSLAVFDQVYLAIHRHAGPEINALKTRNRLTHINAPIVTAGPETKASSVPPAIIGYEQIARTKDIVDGSLVLLQVLA